MTEHTDGAAASGRPAGSHAARGGATGLLKLAFSGTRTRHVGGGSHVAPAHTDHRHSAHSHAATPAPVPEASSAAPAVPAQPAEPASSAPVTSQPAVPAMRPRGRAHAKRRGAGPRLIAQAAVVAMILGGVAGFASLHKDVTVDVDGVRTQVSTLAGSVGQVLKEKHVSVSDRDLVAPAVTARVPKSGDIVVRHARQLAVDIDGQDRTVWTTATTVQDALEDLGVRVEAADLSVSRSASVARLDRTVQVTTTKSVTVLVDGQTLPVQTASATVADALSAVGVSLGDKDQVTPALTSPVASGQTITVTRAVSKNGTEKQVIPFQTKKVNDPDLYKGDQQVTQQGKAGESVVTYASTKVGGKEVDRKEVSQVVVALPQTKIVHVGTKPLPKAAKGGSGSQNVPDVSTNVTPGSAQSIAKSMVSDPDQFKCLVALWNRESGWRVNASNGYSGAYGIPQALPGSKMASAGADWRTSASTQIKWGLGYIRGRYGTPCGAWAAWQSKGWY
ncbi:MAG: ubiquitin-like domain-containing protein [Bifidobacteriaceae bacterium]|nr:ubiquitin-like domain-containing protein [Bifidobacteriaceae bacterium]